MSLISVNNLTFAYDGSYDNVFENVSFSIDTDWKLGFVGRNGRGKTTFLNLLLGRYKYSGCISASVEFEYFPYEVKEMSDCAIDIFYELCPNIEDWELIREINLLEVDCDCLYRPFKTLSNGERTKILLAMLFLKENKFLLIDEPTNHLDEKAREVLGEYLKRKKGFILVSHDRTLLDLCTDHTLSINKTNIDVIKGSFSTWFENKTMQDNAEFAENARLKKEISKLNEAAKRSASWAVKAEKGKHRTEAGEKIDKGFMGHKAEKAMKRSKNIEARYDAAIDEKSKLLHNIEENAPLSIKAEKYHKERLALVRDLSFFYDGAKFVIA